MLEGGHHLLLDLQGCQARVLDSTAAMTRFCREVAKVMGTTVVQSGCHKFEPQGVTAFAIIAESHISIHTWPESGKAFVDVFTCQEHFEKDRVVAFIHSRLGAKQARATVLFRNGTQSHALFAGEFEDVAHVV